LPPEAAEEPCLFDGWNYCRASAEIRGLFSVALDRARDLLSASAMWIQAINFAMDATQQLVRTWLLPLGMFA
jgi:hypothetical protein